jgi:hypothetical protein
MNKLTAKSLGEILHAEFKRDGWGDVNTFWLSDPQKLDSDMDSDMNGLYEVLERAAKKINERFEP